MKRWVWMVISLILAYVPLLIPLEGGHGLEPQEKWVARYIGPTNSFDGAYAIAVDGSGNVYVTGESKGSGTGEDYVTIKYNTNGKQLWIARYNGPAKKWDYANAIAIDSSGNVYVTGASYGTSYDYATIKYNTNGKQLWLKTYNGPAKKADSAKAIAVDSSGNVYVTGWSSGLGGGGIHATDYATIKYNTNGKQLWLKTYNGPANSYDDASAIALDSSGNVYVTGTSYGAVDDYVTIKYNTNGEQLWLKTYNGPANSYDDASAIALDSSGNVYVTGTSYGAVDDYATIKYNTNGEQLWVKRYSTPGYCWDYANAIAVDSSGNVYVTGESKGSGTGEDYVTIKYITNGKQLWVKTYNGPAKKGDYANAIAVDSSGNVYVTGASYGTSYDYATIKYNTNGTQLWVKTYNGPAKKADSAKAIAVDSSGNVYVTGTSSGATDDYATIKYNTNGKQLWVKRYNGPADSFDGAYAIAVDSSGNVYVTGWSYGLDGTSDMATIKY